MAVEQHPLVSIGVPVFNGENGLARCLDGVLAQDYPNIEVIISDNGSTDGTQAIAEGYAAKDPRVRYRREEQNRGSGWNFNRVFELSSGRYFMWAAHDDDREPSFVSACVERLEARPDAVLCPVRTAVYVEGHDDLLYLVRYDSFETATGIVARYRETLKRFPATGIYGLYRTSAVRKTQLMQRVIASDLAFIQELSIHGPFVQVPQTLFQYCARRHWNTIDEDSRAFLGVDRKPWWYLPFAALFVTHAGRLLRADVPAATRLRLLWALVGHELGGVPLKIFLRIAGALCPDGQKERFGLAIYRRWMHNPNIEVGNADLFFQRVCKPQLGWWR